MRYMNASEIMESPVTMMGALDYDWREHGVSPRRLPGWTRSQVPQTMDVMARMPAGVRLSFVTNSSSIEMTALTTTMLTPPRAPRPAVFDLEIEGDIASAGDTDGNKIFLDPADRQNYRLERGAAFVVRFENLGSSSKICHLWLPHNAFVEIRSLALDDGASLEAAPAPSNRWVHYGSSISHCMEAEQPTGTWPAVAARQSNMTLYGMGFGGECHLDQFVARSIRELDVDVISIKTGINVVNMDSMRERAFIPALHGFLDTIRETRPHTPIIIASPIFCPSTEHSPGPTIANAEGKFITLSGHEEIQTGCLTLSRIREIIAELVETRRRLGDRQLGYVDGLELFGETDAHDLPDDLHPSADGYRRLGRRFADRVFSEGGLLSELRG